MDITAHLYEIASELGIEVRQESLHLKHHPKLDGYAWPSNSLIVLDRSIIGTRQEICVLAEEIGHCLFPPVVDQVMYHGFEFYGLDSNQRSNCRCLVIKDEHLALRWATGFVIPDMDFWHYLSSGPHELWEWCDNFEVEPWFMSLKISHMLSRSRNPDGKALKRRGAVNPGIIRLVPKIHQEGGF